MPRRKPKPRELDTEHALRELFPKKVREKVRREARKAAPDGKKKATKDKFR